MPKTRELPLEIRTMIVGLHNLGRINRDIPRKLKLGRGTVDYNVKKYQEASTLLNRKRTGRWNVTTPAEDRRIIITSKRNRRKTAHEITAETNIEREKRVSSTTMKKRLREGGATAKCWKQMLFHLE